MGRHTVWALCLLVLCAGAYAEEAATEADDYEDVQDFRAVLIAHKSLECPADQYFPLIVVGRPITVHVEVVNAGNGAATDVVFTDTLPSNAQLVDGSLSVTWPKIAFGSSMNHSYTITFTSGGSAEVTFLPAATVKYQAEENSQQIGESSRPALLVLTPVQQITRYALIAGSYASFGICTTTSDWRNMAAVLGVLGGLLGANWAVHKMRSSSTDSKRRKALKELEKEQ